MDTAGEEQVVFGALHDAELVAQALAAETSASMDPYRFALGPNVDFDPSVVYEFTATDLEMEPDSRRSCPPPADSRAPPTSGPAPGTK